MSQSAAMTFPVAGMTCASCVAHVEGALRELPGVASAAVNLATNKAAVAYDPARVSLQDMRRAVEDVGYSVPETELTLDVRGMTCASCVAHGEGALKDLPGVTAAVVNLGLATARVRYVPGLGPPAQMRRAAPQ